MYLFQSGSGRLQLVNSLSEEWQRIRTGERYYVQYRLDFPVRFPLPTVKSIVVNNQLICSGSKPSKCAYMYYSFSHVTNLLLKNRAELQIVRPIRKKFCHALEVISVCKMLNILTTVVQLLNLFHHSGTSGVGRRGGGVSISDSATPGTMFKGQQSGRKIDNLNAFFFIFL
jgi:hypothetical protein